MIYLNKPDEGAFRHLSFNQSPPALAPRQTTCQDLNGITNIRTYVAACQDGGTGHEEGDTGQDEILSTCRPPEGRSSLNAGRWFDSPGKAIAQIAAQVPARWSWITWLTSVFISAYLLNRFTHEPLVSPVRRVKRSTCASGGVKEEYNTGLHAAALFIIWFVSTAGCAFPIMATKFPGLRIPRRFFFAVRHFGTGVLIATAFVHLLPTAFVSLHNECLGDFWVNDYEAMPGAIALAAIFLVTVIEMVFHPARHVAKSASCCDERPRQKGEIHGNSTSIGQGLTQLNQDSQDSTEDEARALSPEQKLRKDRLQCILLEMGILFHSVFIGMALSVSIGTDFVVLLIAIVFHRLALGSRIATIEWGAKSWQPWLMAIAYGCTGQAIGLATHTLYSPDSEVGLILVGVMNAISAGLLVFASLVELLSEDFLSDESWRHLRGKRRIVACVFVFLGAFFMSLVGAWA